jgi:deoxyribodipyrimidine photolyase-related protein
MNKTFVILPTQLFEKTHVNNYKKEGYKFVLWEHPQYFTKYKFNKKKLILHKASMMYYYNDLKKSGFDITYKPFGVSMTKLTDYILFDPIDKIKLPGKYKFIESPNFLLDKELYKKYRKKTKHFIFYNFYMWGKQQINVIPDVKSTDKENRKSLPDNIKAPDISSNKEDAIFIKLGVDYVTNKFDDNYGNVDKFIFPVTHNTAKKWLKEFIKDKMTKFGDYQDAIHKDNSFLFHSVLSTSINIGLLNPSDIITELLKHKKKIPINSFEGYIRQLFWREYQRYCYIYYNFDNKNYFGNTKKLSKDWYNGTTEILPVDDCIKKGFNSGYLNHIERLMVVGNVMNLSQIHHNEGFKWFMEFSCDSYEWVMVQNVLDMVFFVSGGVTTRKPYVSSSNYILKMSNYKKGDWCDTWDKLYSDFVKRNTKKLYKFRYYFSGIK